jgi:DNA-binding transcriptional regulator YiaG
MTGSELRKIREELGMTQIEFAALLGYGSNATVALWEADKRPVPRWTANHVRLIMEARKRGAN